MLVRCMMVPSTTLLFGFSGQESTFMWSASFCTQYPLACCLLLLFSTKTIFFYVLLLLKIVPLQYSWRHFCCHSRSLNPFQIPWRKKEFLLCFPHPHPKLSLLHWNTHRGNESFIRTGDSSDRL